MTTNPSENTLQTQQAQTNGLITESNEQQIPPATPVTPIVPTVKGRLPMWVPIAGITLAIGVIVLTLLSRRSTSTQSSSANTNSTTDEKIILDQEVIAENISPNTDVDWLNFTNQTGEIQFSYPNDWHISEASITATNSAASNSVQQVNTQQQINLQHEAALILIRTNVTQAPRVATKYQGEPFKLDGHELFLFRYLDLSSQTKQVGLANASYNQGFFSLANQHYEVFLSYPSAYTSEQERQVLAVFQQVLQSMKLPKQNPLTSQTWQSYVGAGGAFTIKYPTNWRQVEAVNFIGFGPIEVQEDTIFNVSIYDTSDKTRTKVKADIGKQFADRQQTSQDLFVAGLNAEKVITTTASYPNWYAESIFIKSDDRLYVISNGAQKNDQLQIMLNQRTTSKEKITFEDFYHSFRL